MATADLANLITRLEVVVQKLESSTGGASGDTAEVARFVEEYDVFVNDYISPYLSASAALGGAADEQAKLFKAISDELRKFLVTASKCSAPKDPAVVGKLVAGMSEKMGKMDACKRTAKLDKKNHVNAACEGVAVFGWITYPKTPMKHVEETRDSVKFYTNKVLVETKNGDKAAEHKAWVSAYVGVFDGLHSYIKDHHRTGVSWNAKGPMATESSSAAPAPSGGAGGAPPPPPPPVPAYVPAPAPSKAPSASAVSALMSDINRGADVTKGLKKVTNDMKTHKNPDLRKHAAVPFKPKTSEYKPIGKPAAAPKKPPKLELQGKKWVVENQSGRQDLSITDVAMKQSVYIYRCDNSTITVGGKVNSIIVDSCKKFGLVFTSVVSGVEVINSQSIQVQAQGQMPTISVDKTDGFIVYLSKDCLDCRVVTAKSSEMNVCRPKADGDFEEYPIIEQFCSYWDEAKKTFVTVANESLG